MNGKLVTLMVTSMLDCSLASWFILRSCSLHL